MSVILKADNRILLNSVKFSYLVDNYAAGVSTVSVVSSGVFSVNDIVLIGDFGQDNSEIARVSAVSTGSLSLISVAGSSFGFANAHSESTKITTLPYNQVQFYWTAATNTIADENPVFSTSTPLGSAFSIDPTNWYTTYSDAAHSSGFGWFIYINSVSASSTANSNPIPYGGFSANTVASVFADFDSLLNVSELKLVTFPDKFAWLNEALAQVKNKLNLSNVEYTVSVPQIITTVGGTAEYQLPDDFSDMISVSTYSTTPNTVGTTVDYIPVYQVDAYSGNVVKYYLRNRYIGFAPTPTSGQYQYRYRARASRVTSLSDYIDLPDNTFYVLKDWMLFRAGLKFANPNSQIYSQNFTNTLNLAIQASVKRDANLDSWGIADEANA